jgi:diguanylate cyclase (GGDEF)-like protein
MAEDRDEKADADDEASDARDDRATARDERAAQRDEDSSEQDVEAAADRAGASRDRRKGASDRDRAAEDRAAAASDRKLSAYEREVSSIDELTGAYTRTAGVLELQREFDRSKRTDQSFILAFVDVDGLKETNDSLGHLAGDRLLRRTVTGIHTLLRSYDLVVRFGGDEFVCAVVDAPMADIKPRFDGVNDYLKAAGGGSITVGLAQMQPEDTLEGLIARADDALYEVRAKGRSAVT